MSAIQMRVDIEGLAAKVAEMELRLGALESAASTAIADASKFLSKAMEDMQARIAALEEQKRFKR